MQPDAIAAARRILVVRLDNIGDVILTGPMARNLRAAYPTATIGLLASPAGATASPLLPWYDEVIAWRTVWQDLGGRLPLDPQRELELVERLRDGAWDAALILTSHNQTPWPAGYAAYLAGIPIRAGFARDFGGSVLTHVVEPPPDACHHAERDLALLAALRIPLTDGTDLRVVLPDDARRSIAGRLARHGLEPGEPIVIVPGASAPARRMAPERFARAAARIRSASGRPIVVATTTRERPLLEAIRDVAPGAISLGDDLSVPEYAALIDAAALVLCANSSALHLADALRRPVVAAYAGTDALSAWQPRSTPTELLAISVPCAPCQRIECPYENACLAIDPERMAAAAIRLLADAAATRRASALDAVEAVEAVA